MMHVKAAVILVSYSEFERCFSDGGFSVLRLFSGVSGKWETFKKGNARMQPNYGVASWLREGSHL